MFFVLLLAVGALSAVQAAERITVFAAASMTDALEDIGSAYRKAQGTDPDTDIVFSFAGTGTLARQVEAGAPADVFVSADEAWMDYLRERQAVQADTIEIVAGNQLVLIGPAGASPLPLKASAIEQRLGDGRLAIADPDTVPAGRYGKEAFEALGLWKAVKGQLAPMENVRVALATVGRGDVPLGLVYASDAHADPNVATVARIPADSHPPIRYPAALTPWAKPGADGFLRFLMTPEAQRIFEQSGFTVLHDKNPN
nr:molybdate ABC transporter substrate-binding protein [Roseibium sp. RKSG952]